MGPYEEIVTHHDEVSVMRVADPLPMCEVVPHYFARGSGGEVL